MCLFVLTQTFFISGCNFNLLGGKNSEISTGYTPGLRTESLPPTISPFMDVEMDENDVVQVSFQISDPDTFLFCSGINVAARSSDQTVLMNKNMTVTGTYPDCVLNISAGSVTASKQITITVDLFDYWSTVSSAFKLTIRRVGKPGPFQITSTEGLRMSAIVNWSPSENMDGSSGRYYLYYRKVDNQTLQTSPFAGVMPVYQASPAASQTLFTEVRNVTSPFWITAPNHTLDNGQIYEVYVTARNGFNNKNPNVPPEETQHVFIRTLDRFQFKVREFVASSQQEYKAPVVHTATCAGGASGTVPLSPVSLDCSDTNRYFTQATLGSPMQYVWAPTPSYRFRTYLNAQGLMFGEIP